jgi:hypothetical protein
MAKAAAKLVTDDIGVIRKARWRFGGMVKVVGIQTVHHFDLVAGVAERVSKAIRVNRVAAETVWGIKR